ncbi:uncharacterized protein [Nicotiana sylvestris]|uniref:uncharacterized protein n=1 Tax=Nicotiana sylvestris TaxID=4096 RepID=UPI00388C671C
MNMKAFNGSQRDTIGEINLCLQMGPTWFDVEFLLDISASYNLLLGRPWIHVTGAMASTLHEAMKFKWKHQEVIIHGDGSNPIYTSVIITFPDEPVTVTCNEAMQHEDSDSDEEDEIPEEVVSEVKNFENKPKSNLDKTEAVNLGDAETVKETRIRIHLSPTEKEEYIRFLKGYEDIFAWSYDDMTGYHQIWMDEEDAEKTAFITPWGAYCYKIMPFGLKNVRATYMRVMTTIFHDMIHKEIDVYVDDVIIKSKRVEDHIANLRKFFDRLRRYNLKLNPAKCAFRVPAT